MILATRSGNVELRAGEWGTEHIIPRHWSSWGNDTGNPVSERDAYGLPAVSNVIRSASDIIASLPFFVYRNTENREEARDSWQWQLLHEQPSPYCDSYRFFYDLNLSLEALQNAFIHKVRGVGSRRNRLEALEVIDPHRVKVSVSDSGEKTFEIYISSGKVAKLTSREILHVRGFTPNPGDPVGTSLIELHANALGAQRAAQKFEGEYFKNQGVPPFWFTGATNSTHAKEIVDAYKQNRTRALSGDPGGLWGQIDVKHIPISLADATYVETKALSIQDVCAIWQWPVWMLDDRGERVADPNARMSEFLRTRLLPRLRRIERSFAADSDIFAGQPLFGEFLTAAFERGDVVSRYNAYRLARQGGWITANELRKLENLPPHEGGDELQETPVGGAPNPGSTD